MLMWDGMDPFRLSLAQQIRVAPCYMPHGRGSSQELQDSTCLSSIRTCAVGDARRVVQRHVVRAEPGRHSYRDRRRVAGVGPGIGRR